MNQNCGNSCKKYGCGRVRLLQPRLESEVALTAKKWMPDRKVLSAIDYGKNGVIVLILWNYLVRAAVKT